jgi:hypothetical protein
MEFTAISILIGLSINGLFTGIGVALGTYFVNKHLVKKIENISIKGSKLKNITRRFGDYVKGETDFNNYKEVA